jgi:hypothetical protein
MQLDNPHRKTSLAARAAVWVRIWLIRFFLNRPLAIHTANEAKPTVSRPEVNAVLAALAPATAKVAPQQVQTKQHPSLVSGQSTN